MDPNLEVNMVLVHLQNFTEKLFVAFLSTIMFLKILN